MRRADKERIVGELREELGKAAVVYAAGYRGLNVAQMSQLRREVRGAGATIRVAKNRLARRALEGTPCAAVERYLDGPTALAWSDEPVGVAKALCEFADSSGVLVVRGGAMGEAVLDTARVEAIAKLPSMEELRAKVLGVLAAPASKAVRTINEPASRLARLLAARRDSLSDAAPKE